MTRNRKLVSITYQFYVKPKICEENHMSIMTLNGPIDRNEAGIIAPHEHVFIDITNQAPAQYAISKRRLSRDTVNITNLDRLSRNPYFVLDNLRLDEEDVAVEELFHFRAAGGTTMVDATPVSIGRDPEALNRVGIKSGVKLVTGCGFYTGDTHPAYLKEQSVNEIAEIMLRDIQEGIDGTRFRAGVIGEIGTSAEILPGEKKVLAAAGIAQSKTGLGVHVHTYPWGKEGLEAIEILKKNGADAGKITIDHVDVDINIDYCVSLVKTGAFIEFDNFGKEFYIDAADRKDFAGGAFMTDVDRVKALKQLIEKGCADHILLTCDVCLKTLIHRYGGWGYDHVLSHIVSMMRDFDIDENAIETIIRKNPANFLDS